jgi:hypothetical protein
MAEESVVTMMAASRVPHAPVFVHVLTLLDSLSRAAVEPEPAVMRSPHRYEFQRWVKAVERGIVIFMERSLEGRAPDLAELRRLREQVLARYPDRPSAVRRLVTQVGHRVGAVVGRRVRDEWCDESRAGVGPLTRVGLSALAWSDTGRIGEAVRCFRSGEYHAIPERRATPPETRAAAWDLAGGAISEARTYRDQVVKLMRRANAPEASSPEPAAADEEARADDAMPDAVE